MWHLHLGNGRDISIRHLCHEAQTIIGQVEMQMEVHSP